MVENFVGKGENAGNQYFLLFPQCFQKPSLSGRQKLRLCSKEFRFKKKMKISQVCIKLPRFKPITRRQNFRLVQTETSCR